MRCKRCGELLEPTDTRCPVCGKTLTPPRKKAPAQKPSETHIKLPQLDKFTHAYSRDAARSRVLQLATIGAVIAAIALLVLVYTGVGELQTAVKDLKQTAAAQLQAMQNQPQAATQPQTEPSVESTDAPTDASPLPLDRQNVEAALTLYHTAGGTYAAAVMELGDYEDQALAWVSTRQTGADRQTHVSWILVDSGDRMDLTLRDSWGGETAQFFAGLTWALEGDTFQDLSDAVCIWEYRVSGGQWESLPIAHVTAVPGGCEVCLTTEELGNLLGQTSGMELRCHVSMTHPDGGTMRVLAGPMALNAAGPVVSGTLLD